MVRKRTLYLSLMVAQWLLIAVSAVMGRRAAEGVDIKMEEIPPSPALTAHGVFFLAWCASVLAAVWLGYRDRVNRDLLWLLLVLLFPTLQLIFWVLYQF